MSGEDVKARAGVARATTDAPGASAKRTRVIEEPAWYSEPAHERAWAVPVPREAIENAIRELVGRRQRVTLTALATELRVDYATVRRWRKKLGMPHPAEIARHLPR